MVEFNLKVCTGLTRGPGLGAQIMFGFGPGSGLVQIIELKRSIEYFGLFLGRSFFAKKKLFVVALILWS
jgi:hypothetical protein